MVVLVARTSNHLFSKGNSFSFLARDVYCSAVCNRLAIDKALAFYIAGTPATGFECTSHDENRSDK
jgi:hypothetical protein